MANYRIKMNFVDDARNTGSKWMNDTFGTNWYFDQTIRPLALRVEEIIDPALQAGLGNR